MANKRWYSGASSVQVWEQNLKRCNQDSCEHKRSCVMFGQLTAQSIGSCYTSSRSLYQGKEDGEISVVAVLAVRLWRISRLLVFFDGKNGTPVDWNVICPWKPWKEDISPFRMHQTQSPTDRRLLLRVPTANAEATAIFEIPHFENPRKSSLSQASICTHSHISKGNGSRDRF